MKLTEEIALKLRTAQEETGRKITPDDAILLMPFGEYTTDKILGFETWCANVSEITLAVKDAKYGKLVRIFEDTKG